MGQEKRGGEGQQEKSRVDLLPVAAVLGVGLLMAPDITCRVVGAGLVIVTAKEVGLFKERRN